MLRISKLTDYGTLIMVHMASLPLEVHRASELAEHLGLGQPTVSKVLKLLARHELVNSLRGAHGGYVLARAPHTITVADIVDALEDQAFGLTECSSASGLCGREAQCRIRDSWLHINAVVRRALEAVNLADMAGPSVHADRGHPIHGPGSSIKPALS